MAYVYTDQWFTVLIISYLKTKQRSYRINIVIKILSIKYKNKSFLKTLFAKSFKSRTCIV